MTKSVNNNLVIEDYHISQIPVLVCFSQDGVTPKPLVLLSHSFGSAKENLKDRSKILAEMGYYAVSIDNRGHGKREEPAFSVQVFKNKLLDVYQVRRLIKETADDIPSIIDHLEANDMVDTKRIGMLGVSMGGFVALRALVIEDRIKVATPVIASPYWDDIPKDVNVLATSEANQRLSAYSREFSPANHIHKFFPRPILIQIGGKDNHYNVEKVKQFYQTIKSYYHESRKAVKLIIHEEEGHNFTELMWFNAVTWFQNYL